MRIIDSDTKKQADVFGLIRFISAIAIVLFHYNKLTGGTHDDIELPAFSVLHLAYMHGGDLVELFFIISGFCFVLFYKDRIEMGEIGFKRYIMHRYLRSVPSYWLATIALIVIMLLSINILGATIAGAGRALGNNKLVLMILDILCLNFVNPINGVSWFLAVNLICYIVYYFIFSKGRTDAAKWLISGICIVCASVYVVIIQENQLTNIARGIASFGIGGGIALLNNYLIHNNKKQFYVLIVSVIAILVSIKGLYIFRLNKSVNWAIEVYLLFPSICVLITNSAVISRLLTKNIFNTIGSWAFSIYIFQTAAMSFLFFMCKIIGFDNWYSMTSLVITLLFVLLFGVAMYYWWELPIKRIVKKVEEKI